MASNAESVPGPAARASLALLASIALAACTPKDAPPDDAGTSAADAGPLANAKCDATSGGRAQIDQCYVRAALENLEPRYCASVQGPAERNACLSGLATKLGDAALCGRIDDPRAQGECADGLARSRRSPAPCQVVTAAAIRSKCVRVAAKAADDPSLCDGIEAADEKDGCYVDLADRNPDLCDKPASLDRRDNCFQVAAMKSPELCARIGSPSMRDGCFRMQATKDPTLCDKIGAGDAGASAREQCWTMVAASTTSKDPSVCAKMPGDAIADRCLARVAENARDPSLCDKVKGAETKDGCFFDLASMNEPGPCLRIVSAAKKKACAQRSFALGKSPELCSLLDGDDKKRCLKAVADAAARKK